MLKTFRNKSYFKNQNFLRSGDLKSNQSHFIIERFTINSGQDKYRVLIESKGKEKD